MNGKKYLLVPGWLNRDDGTREYITALDLANFYGVPLHECVIAREDGLGRFSEVNLIWLTTRQDGNYEVPYASH